MNPSQFWGYCGDSTADILEGSYISLSTNGVKLSKTGMKSLDPVDYVGMHIAVDKVKQDGKQVFETMKPKTGVLEGFLIKSIISRERNHL